MTDWYAATTSQPEQGTQQAQTPVESLTFKSRRSPVLSKNGSVSTSQPLASTIGLSILTQTNGNAADAAVAIAAALSVLEPCSTGLGGDMFALYYDGTERSVGAVNGSGRCVGNLTLDLLRRTFPSSKDGSGVGIGSEMGVNVEEFKKSVHSVTVPGAARGWEDFYHKYGSGNITFAQLLEPAAILAEEGFPVSPITAHYWERGLEMDIKRWYTEEEMSAPDFRLPLSVDGKSRGPKAGDIMYNPEMARVLRSLGKYGATKGFYESWPGEAIVAAVQKHGGVMTMDDLKEEWTKTTYPDPIAVEYQGVKLWQVPPNGQGISGLIALSGLDFLHNSGKWKKQGDTIEFGKVDDSCNGGWSNAQTWHVMIEMMRLGFADARSFVCDPDFQHARVHDEGDGKGEKRTKSNEWLLNKERIANRAGKLYKPTKAVVQGIPDPANGTVSFQVVDKDNNAVSFVNSNFLGFGTGLVPEGCGFTLQNRGFGFVLNDPSHPNALEPRKRPYHTIIPGMITHSDTNELFATISNMGGFMQPQGHMQLTVALTTAGLDPQAAIDMPRFCIADGTSDGAVFLEDGVDENIVKELKAMGHKLQSNINGFGRSLFGKAQIIKRDRYTGVLWAGSDGRSDGCAMGY